MGLGSSLVHGIGVQLNLVHESLTMESIIVYGSVQQGFSLVTEVQDQEFS